MENKKESHPEIDWLKNPSTFAKIQITKFILFTIYFALVKGFNDELGDIYFAIWIIYFEIIWLTIAIGDRKFEK